MTIKLIKAQERIITRVKENNNNKRMYSSITLAKRINKTGKDYVAVLEEYSTVSYDYKKWFVKAFNFVKKQKNINKDMLHLFTHTEQYLQTEYKHKIIQLLTENAYMIGVVYHNYNKCGIDVDMPIIKEIIKDEDDIIYIEKIVKEFDSTLHKIIHLKLFGARK